MLQLSNEECEGPHSIEKIIACAKTNGVNLECLEENSDLIALSISGDLTSADYGILMDTCFDLINAGKSKFIFNLSKLNYPLSSGIGVFTQILKKIKESKNGQVIFYSISSKLMEVFQLLGYTQYFEIAEDESEAVYLAEMGEHRNKTFPFRFYCPICNFRQTILNKGQMRCSSCGNIININEEFQIELGDMKY